MIFGNRFDYGDEKFRELAEAMIVTLVSITSGQLISIFPFLRFVPYGECCAFRISLSHSRQVYRKCEKERKGTKGREKERKGTKRKETKRNEKKRKRKYRECEKNEKEPFALSVDPSRLGFFDISWPGRVSFRPPPLHNFKTAYCTITKFAGGDVLVQFYNS